jgi:hypothetical protein
VKRRVTSFANPAAESSRRKRAKVGLQNDMSVAQIQVPRRFYDSLIYGSIIGRKKGRRVG